MHGVAASAGRAYLAEIIEKVNGLFVGELTDNYQLVNVNVVLKGKLQVNAMLVPQAASSNERFANSPDLKDALMPPLWMRWKLMRS